MSSNSNEPIEIINELNEKKKRNKSLLSNTNEKVKKKSTLNKSLVDHQNIGKPKIEDNRNEFLKYLISKKKNYQGEKLKLMVSSLAYYEEDNILAIATVDRNVNVKIRLLIKNLKNINLFIYRIVPYLY